MKHFKLTFVLLFFSQFLPAQNGIPDFSVTDSHSETHALYTDYLDEDKTVLIKFFYSTCPPCNAIAGNLQLLYEEWGHGEADVEFIELSVQSWETNNTVNQYHDKHNITFPGVSAQGGSIQAIDAIEDAGFGPVNSTPTFAVISPEKSVTWNIRGATDAATLDLIDQAIAATGATKPTSTLDPDGQKKVFDVTIQPNPVSNLLQISLSLPEAGDASLVIYSIIGNKIEEISLGYLEAGEQKVQHAIAGYKRGNYIVRAELNERHLKSIRFIKT